MAAMQALTYKADQLRLLSLKQLRELQVERKMKGETYNPADDGFVFSTKTFERFQSRETHFSEALIAARVEPRSQNSNCRHKTVTEPRPQGADPTRK
jgi:hypothetical protein